MRPATLALLLALSPSLLLGQPLAERYAALGTTIVTTSAHTMFPHPERANGHVYGGKTYPADPHYSDRTVVIFVPKGFRPGETTDIVFFFHGWGTNVDRTLATFRIAEQLGASGVNAVLVLAEGPKDAPDSFGGRLEEEGVFSGLVADVLATLKERGVIEKARPGSIVLAGHSGAGRVISLILLRGGLTANVREVYLFDALYGQVERFAWWVDHTRGRLVVIHSPGGGTRARTIDFMADLRARGVPFARVPESAVTAELLRKSRLVFIESALAHEDVVAAQGQLRTYLETGALGRR
jgi:hypothetical protein